MPCRAGSLFWTSVNAVYVYVSEFGGHCVSVFTVAGDFVCSFGGRGGGEGEFFNPLGVSVDREGFLYVCDLGNFRIQIY